MARTCSSTNPVAKGTTSTGSVVKFQRWDQLALVHDPDNRMAFEAMYLSLNSAPPPPLME